MDNLWIIYGYHGKSHVENPMEHFPCSLGTSATSSCRQVWSWTTSGCDPPGEIAGASGSSRPLFKKTSERPRLRSSNLHLKFHEKSPKVIQHLKFIEVSGFILQHTGIRHLKKRKTSQSTCIELVKQMRILVNLGKCGRWDYETWYMNTHQYIL